MYVLVKLTIDRPVAVLSIQVASYFGGLRMRAAPFTASPRMQFSSKDSLGIRLQISV